MTFNPNIPQPSDLMSNSQQDFLTNNQALDATFGRNHRPFSDETASNGKHTFVEMVIRPDNSFLSQLSSSTGTLYTKTVNGRSQLFYTPDNSGREYQITNTSSANFTTWGAADNGWVWIGNNLILQYGFRLHANENSLAVVFPVEFTANPYNIQVTSVTSSSDTSNRYSSAINNATTTGFTIRTDTSTNLVRVNWTAIGPFNG